MKSVKIDLSNTIPESCTQDSGRETLYRNGLFALHCGNSYFDYDLLDHDYAFLPVEEIQAGSSA